MDIYKICFFIKSLITLDNILDMCNFYNGLTGEFFIKKY